MAENKSPWSRGYTHVIYFRILDAKGGETLKADPRRAALSKRVDDMEEHGIGIVFEADAAGEK